MSSGRTDSEYFSDNLLSGATVLSVAALTYCSLSYSSFSNDSCIVLLVKVSRNA
jgi:hypothetical protein